MVSTPGSFDGALNNKTPVVTECEIHWVVNLIQANVTASILVEKALETLQFESDFDNPWDPADPTKYRANFSLTLPDPHSVTGNYSTFGLSNTTAYQVAAVRETVSHFNSCLTDSTQ
jgi:hypothetical protein